MRSFLLVVLGGAAGTMSRYGIAQGVQPDSLFPVATFVVNIVGSFALGALLAVLGRQQRAERLLLGTGFLGGFTTYSALAVETDDLLRTDHVVLGLTYAIGTVVLGVLAAGAGIAAARTATR